MIDFRTLDLSTLTANIRSRKITSTQVVKYYLDRISALDDRLKSFVYLSDTALKQAKQADKLAAAGKPLGVLQGVPIAIKDNYLTQDMPTTAGTEAPGISFPQIDSFVVSRLREAGAILLGKTRTHEFAWGNVTPPTRNPWHLSLIHI